MKLYQYHHLIPQNWSIVSNLISPLAITIGKTLNTGKKDLSSKVKRYPFAASRAELDMLVCDRGMSNLEYHARNYTSIMTIKLTNVLSVAGMINLAIRN